MLQKLLPCQKTLPRQKVLQSKKIKNRAMVNETLEADSPGKMLTIKEVITTGKDLDYARNGKRKSGAGGTV